MKLKFIFASNERNMNRQNHITQTLNKYTWQHIQLFYFCLHKNQYLLKKIYLFIFLLGFHCICHFEYTHACIFKWSLSPLFDIHFFFCVYFISIFFSVRSSTWLFKLIIFVHLKNKKVKYSCFSNNFEVRQNLHLCACACCFHWNEFLYKGSEWILRTCDGSRPMCKNLLKLLVYLMWKYYWMYCSGAG